MDRLKASYDTLTVLEKDKDSKSKLEKETTKLCRVLKVLHEYVMECDADFGEERTFVPLYRAPRGKQIVLLFRLASRFPELASGKSGRKTQSLSLLRMLFHLLYAEPFIYFLFEALTEGCG